MGNRCMFTSVTRIANLDRTGFEIQTLPREEWGEADYVAADVTGNRSSLYRLELASGRLIEVMHGTRVVGAFGKRAATLEAVGDWERIPADGSLQALTGAGLFGWATSVAPWLPRLLSLSYVGHVVRDGNKLTMADFVNPAPPAEFTMPVVLLVGTSMSAGKTTAGRIIINELSRAGLKVVGAKLTGAGRYRDVLSFKDAGADAIVDFVDAGLPSTVVPRERFRTAMDYMLRRIAATGADVLVAEAGASPLEPYNGETAVAMLGNHVCCTVLCASDPYSVVGVRSAYRMEPDFVTGPATNTGAAQHLVKKLTGLDGINLMEESAIPDLRRVLQQRLPPGLFDSDSQ